MSSVLGVGRVERKSFSQRGFSRADDAWRFKVDSIQDSIVLNHYFSKYPLYTQKASIRYVHWKQILEWRPGAWFPSSGREPGTGPKRARQRARQLQGPNVIRANLSKIKEFAVSCLSFR